MLTPHNGQRYFGLGRIQTCVHPHGSPAHYHCATGGDLGWDEFHFLLEQILP